MRDPKARLSYSEQVAAQRLVRERGAKQAARLLGLCAEETVRKAALGEPVHPLTVRLVRANLSKRTNGGGL